MSFNTTTTTVESVIGHKGFGFLTDGGDTVIFIHVAALKEAGFVKEDLLDTSTVMVEVSTAADGRRTYRGLARRCRTGWIAGYTPCSATACVRRRQPGNQRRGGPSPDRRSQSGSAGDCPVCGRGGDPGGTGLVGQQDKIEPRRLP